MINSPLIELVDVSVEFFGQRKLSGISFNVTRGEFVTLHGSTGSGKSLILNLIAGLLIPSSGKVLVAGDLVNTMSERQKLWMRRTMGIMVQEGLLLEDRSVLDNVMLPALAAEESSSESRRRALIALDKCGIHGLASQFPDGLSSGQKQLVCLARAVVNRPVVILADEPASHLDVDNAQTLMDLLGDFSLAGVTVIVASHLQLIPQSVAFRTLHLPSPGEPR